MKLLAPSILSADIANLSEQIKLVEKKWCRLDSL